MTGPLLEVRELSKSFGSVAALSDVSLTVESGQVHAIMGENGAGKSTLIKALSGIQPATSGSVRMRGAAVSIRTLEDAKALGIRTVFQELHIVPQLSVAENILLGALPRRNGLIDAAERDRVALHAMEELGVRLDASRPAGRLSRSEQQIIEICRALLGEVELLILDEPTASLGEPETRQLLGIVRRLTQRGVGVIYVSHRMNEVLEIADTVTVLRDGEYIATHEPPVAAERLVQDMIGRPPGELYNHEAVPPGDILLETRGITNAGIENVSITVRAGEIVGITGLIGSGKSELARAIFGLDRIESGRVVLGGADCSACSPARMLRRGLVYYPSDRKREGLVLGRSLKESITLGALERGGFLKAGIIRSRLESAETEKLAERLSLRPPTTAAPAGSYSGGNQQKALLARGMLQRASVHVFDEPTVGIDVGAKADVYAQMDAYATAGAGVILVSSDLVEVIGVSDRVYVIAEGRVQAELTGDDINETTIASHFFTTS
ncbi:sugar ABC transporter ATP-binding protein [Leucobacter sp.]